MPLPHFKPVRHGSALLPLQIGFAGETRNSWNFHRQGLAVRADCHRRLYTLGVAGRIAARITVIGLPDVMESSTGNTKAQGSTNVRHGSAFKS